MSGVKMGPIGGTKRMDIKPINGMTPDGPSMMGSTGMRSNGMSRPGMMMNGQQSDMMNGGLGNDG